MHAQLPAEECNSGDSSTFGKEFRSACVAESWNERVKQGQEDVVSREPADSPRSMYVMDTQRSVPD